MENYTLSLEPAIDKSEPLHSIQLDSNVIHMNVKTGSKVANLVNYAIKQFEEDSLNQITWNGTGDALNKVVACAEIMKKKIKNLYQINKIGFARTEEQWKSNLENLRDIRIVREIPRICIIISKTPLDPNESGYQISSTVKDLFNQRLQNKPRTKDTDKNAQKSIETDESIYVKKKKPKNKN
ncbi:ribonuclease P subunit p25 [Brachionus plicatilis]|uniref:Ribonuclease P subunit p25 n=1 Tax=Brachionus plicatilis TaxID=10195 RepID=A0A3M7QF67_BRAPC|nr:ribonuclease P subunit p25 [Brachionus plicatilis]